jgi:transcription elongation factor Elf1
MADVSNTHINCYLCGEIRFQARMIDESKIYLTCEDCGREMQFISSDVFDIVED